MYDIEGLSGIFAWIKIDAIRNGRGRNSLNLLVARMIDARGFIDTPASIRVTASRNNAVQRATKRERERERERGGGRSGENFPKFANHSAPARTVQLSAKCVNKNRKPPRFPGGLNRVDAFASADVRNCRRHRGRTSTGTTTKNKFPCRARILLLFRFESMKSLREQARPFPSLVAVENRFPRRNLPAQTESCAASRCHARLRPFRGYIFFRTTTSASSLKENSRRRKFVDRLA